MSNQNKKPCTKSTKAPAKKPAKPITQLSKNFSVSEFEFSRRAARLGIKNKMNAAQIKSATKLCKMVLQPLRDYLKSSVSVTSGFRGEVLNAATPGSSNTSYHMIACAGDIRHGSPKMNLEETAQWLMDNHGEHIDTIIYEFGVWLHVQIARPGAKPRSRFLTAYRKNGRTHYTHGLKPELC